MRTLKEWLESIDPRANCLMISGNHARIDVPGWFGSSLREIPFDVEITPKQREDYR